MPLISCVYEDWHRTTVLTWLTTSGPYYHHVIRKAPPRLLFSVRAVPFKVCVWGGGGGGENRF